MITRNTGTVTNRLPVSNKSPRYLYCARSSSIRILGETTENRMARLMFVQQLIQTWSGSVEQSSELVLRVFGKNAAEPLCELLAPSESKADELERATVAINDIMIELGQDTFPWFSKYNNSALGILPLRPGLIVTTKS